MNRLEILSLEAGEKLDSCIAEWKDGCYHVWEVQSVIGGFVFRCTKCKAFRESGQHLPNQDYSTDTSAAFQVVNKMQEDGLSLELIIGADGNTLAHFFDASQIIPDDRSNQVICESVPEAICKAALLTKFSLV